VVVSLCPGPCCLNSGPRHVPPKCQRGGRVADAAPATFPPVPFTGAGEGQGGQGARVVGVAGRRGGRWTAAARRCPLLLTQYDEEDGSEMLRRLGVVGMPARVECCAKPPASAQRVVLACQWSFGRCGWARPPLPPVSSLAWAGSDVWREEVQEMAVLGSHACASEVFCPNTGRGCCALVCYVPRSW